MSFDNLISLQREQNFDERLPMLDAIKGGYYPTTAKDMQLIRHEILARLVQLLPENRIWRRKGKLYQLDQGLELSEIPEQLFLRAFDTIDVQVEIVEIIEVSNPKGMKSHKKQKRFHTMTENLRCLRPYIENESVTRQIIQSRLIPELVFENERPPEGDVWIAPTFPSPSVEAATMARFEFDHWRKWMLGNAPEQLDFFLSIGKEYCFSAEMAAKGENQARRINVGVGANAGGKGTMIRFLNAMATMLPEHSFVFDDLCEWRSGQVFRAGSPMAVCHEFHLDKPLSPGFVGMFKSATRNEVLSVRAVGSASENIRFEGAIVLFCNSNFEKSAALHEAFNYFSDWVAYDRFNVGYIDWFLKYPRTEEIKKILHYSPEVTRAFGECIRQMIFEAKEKEIPHQPIPDEYRSERGAGSVRKWETALENIWFGWQQWQKRVKEISDPLVGAPAEIQRQIAASIFSGIFGQQKDLLLSEFSIFDDAGFLVPCFHVQTIAQFLGKFGATRKWMIPPTLTGRIVRGIPMGKTRARVVQFVDLENEME